MRNGTLDLLVPAQLYPQAPPVPVSPVLFQAGGSLRGFQASPVTCLPSPEAMALSWSLGAFASLTPLALALTRWPVLCPLFLPLLQVSGLYWVRVRTTRLLSKGEQGKVVCRDGVSSGGR